MSDAARRWFILTAVVLLICSAVAPWRVSPPDAMGYPQQTLRGYETLLAIPLLLAGASEGASSDFWMSLAFAAGWLGVACYVAARGTKPRASWRTGLWLLPAVVGFTAVTLSGDPPVWRFWSWGLWLMWAGLASSVLLEATLKRRPTG